ncbi:MAG: hypothetical protein V4754_18380 [Pseudomonadota bacterium]
MDQQRLRNLVFEKTGVKVDSDDPIFALVALNEAVLADTVERQVAQLTAAAEELARQARGEAGAARAPGAGPAGETPPFLPAPAAPVRPIPTQSGQLFAVRELRLLAAAAGISVLSALLVLGGQVLFFKPAPIPAPVYQAMALTPEQSTALIQGERLARAVQKLDPKIRAQIQAELQKQ